MKFIPWCPIQRRCAWVFGNFSLEERFWRAFQKQYSNRVLARPYLMKLTSYCQSLWISQLDPDRYLKIAFVEIKQDIVLFYCIWEKCILEKDTLLAIICIHVICQCFWISGRSYLVCQFNDRWLIFNYNLTLVLVYFYVIQFNHWILSNIKKVERILVSFI